MHRVVPISLLFLLLASGEAFGLSASPETGVEPVATADSQPFAADKVSLEQAVRQVRRQYGGRILSAETQGSGGKRVHVIKVLTDKGRVQTVRIRAN